MKGGSYKNDKNLTSTLQPKGYLQLANWIRPSKLDAKDSRFDDWFTLNPQGPDAKWISETDAKNYFNLRPRLLELAGIGGFESGGGWKYSLYPAYACAQHFHTVTDGSTEQALDKVFPQEQAPRRGKDGANGLDLL